MYIRSYNPMGRKGGVASGVASGWRLRPSLPPTKRTRLRGFRPRNKRTGIAGACLFKRHQYSDGRSSVVALRSASVMIQILVPPESVYADRMRRSRETENSFSC
jgi:hypothetical protein